MDRHFKISGLESSLYFSEDRHCGNPALFCLRDFVTAGIWVIIVMIISFFIMMFVNVFAGRSGKNRIQW